uniref:Uncharacterized protein n=1 Tax=Hanusia phi TaxID=3032 RepID=A0A7S0DZ69_9CRYP
MCRAWGELGEVWLEEAMRLRISEGMLLVSGMSIAAMSWRKRAEEEEAMSWLGGVLALSMAGEAMLTLAERKEEAEVAALQEQVWRLGGGAMLVVLLVELTLRRFPFLFRLAAPLTGALVAASMVGAAVKHLEQ